MVSIFPDLLAFSLLAPFFLRLVVGFFFAFEAWELWARAKAHARQAHEHPHMPAGISNWCKALVYVEFIIGGLLVVGFFTQAAAMGAMALSYALHRSAPDSFYSPHERLVYKLVFFIALSLVFLGVGAFGFDYPL